MYSSFFTFSLFFYGLSQAKTIADIFLILVFSAPTLYFVFDILKQLKLPFITEKKFVVILSFLQLISLFNYSLLFVITFLGLFFHFNFLIFVVFLPLPIYFWFSNFADVKKTEKIIKIPMVKIESEEKKHINEKNQSEKDVVDPLRRQFLKMFGVGGVGLLVAALLNPKKAEAAFFGSVPGPGTVAIKDSSGQKIDPAIKKPTDGYSISQIDSATPSYYGYLDKDGNWYIIKEDSDGSFRYARGSGAFSSYWSTRSSLTYDYFENVF